MGQRRRDADRPLGAWYADDPEQAVHQAEISAYTTHQHREAVVGAMAVAAAAALAADPASPPSAEALLDGVVALVPRSAVGAGLRRARDMLDYGDTATVAAVLGCGRRTTAHDTVPFALWSAARALGDYEEGFWSTAQVGGDMDTTCAIVGGVIAAGKAGAPPGSGWSGRRACRVGCGRGRRPRGRFGDAGESPAERGARAGSGVGVVRHGRGSGRPEARGVARRTGRSPAPYSGALLGRLRCRTPD